MSDTWRTLKEWPELILERLEDAGVARIILNRPDKRNCWNRASVAPSSKRSRSFAPTRSSRSSSPRAPAPSTRSGLDLNFLREVSNGPLLDWDRPSLTIQIAEDVRAFPRIIIAQVHGYCLGGALGIMNCHDLVYRRRRCAARHAGNPSRQFRPAGHLDAPARRPAGQEAGAIALVGRNISGREADALGIVSQAVPADRAGTAYARHRARNRLAAPRAAGASQDHRADGARSLAVAGDPARPARRAAHASAPWTRSTTWKSYLKSQKGGPNLSYKRPDV